MKKQALNLVSCVLFSILFVNITLAQTMSHEGDITAFTFYYQNTVLLDETLYDEIDDVLTLARALDDTFENMHVNYSEDHEMFIRLPMDMIRDTWSQRVWTLGDTYLDSLFVAWGIADNSYLSGSPDQNFPVFSEPLDMFNAVTQVLNSPKVISAQSLVSVIIGEPPVEHLDLSRHGLEWDVTFFEPGVTEEASTHYWFVRVRDGETELLGEYDRLPGEASLQVLPFNAFAVTEVDRYPDLDSLFSDLANDSLWWFQESALAAIYELLDLPYYGKEENADCPECFVSKRGENTGISPGYETLWPEFHERMDEVEQRLIEMAAEAMDPEIGESAAWVQSQLELDSNYDFVPPFPNEFRTPYGETRYHLFTSRSDSLLWPDAFPRDSSDSFKYKLRFTCGDNLYDSGPLLEIKTNHPWLELDSLYSHPAIKPEVEYYVELTAVRTEGAPLIARGSSQYFTLTFTPEPQPFTLIAPEDSVDLRLEWGEEVTFQWNSALSEEGEEPATYALIHDGELWEDLIYVGTDTFLTICPDKWWTWGSSAPSTIAWKVVALHPDHDKWVYSPERVMIYNTLSVEPAVEGLPERFSISSAYPNPFNPTSNIVIAMPERARLKLEVFNLLGRRVAVLSDDVVPQGWRSFVFDGSRLASGIYLVRATVPGKLEQTRRITLVR